MYGCVLESYISLICNNIEKFPGRGLSETAQNLEVFHRVSAL